MALLYADKHFPAPVVVELRRLGHDVLTIQEDGYAGLKCPDAEVLRRATQLGRAVLTLNRRDFIQLHSVIPGHSGIIAATQDLDFFRLASRINDGISAEGSISNRVIRIYRPHS